MLRQVRSLIIYTVKGSTSLILDSSNAYGLRTVVLTVENCVNATNGIKKFSQKYQFNQFYGLPILWRFFDRIIILLLLHLQNHFQVYILHVLILQISSMF